MKASKVRVAAAQYMIERFSNWDELEKKLEYWVAQAASDSVELIVFPEYAAFEMVGLVDRRGSDRRSPDRHLLGPLPVNAEDRRKALNLHWATEVIQPLIPRYLSLLAALAARYHTYILGGSLPLRHADGSLTNTAFFFTPEGAMGSQDKMVLTRWEREIWKMKSGSEVRVFDTAFGPIGINICYDIEFPIIARRQAEARARIILSSCCCDSLRGYYRVRVGARARALENQAYVVQSPAIGNTDWLPEFGRCVGYAGIFGPPDVGPDESGVISQGRDDIPQWIVGDLDLAAIDRIRGSAVIANIAEWTAHTEIGMAVRGNLSNAA